MNISAQINSSYSFRIEKNSSCSVAHTTTTHTTITITPWGF